MQTLPKIHTRPKTIENDHALGRTRTGNSLDVACRSALAEVAVRDAAPGFASIPRADCSNVSGSEGLAARSASPADGSQSATNGKGADTIGGVNNLNSTMTHSK